MAAGGLTAPQLIQANNNRMMVIQQRLNAIENAYARIAGMNLTPGTPEAANQQLLINNINNIKTFLNAEQQLRRQYRAALESKLSLSQKVQSLIDRGAPQHVINTKTQERDQANNHFTTLDGQITAASNAYPQLLAGHQLLDNASLPCPAILDTVVQQFRAPAQQALVAPYPPSNNGVLQVAQQALAALAGFNDPAETGHAIGVAQMQNGDYIISVSGTGPAAQAVMARIQTMMPANPNILYATPAVPTLNLNAPQNTGNAPPTRKCALPKLYHTAQQLGGTPQGQIIPVTNVVELWWDGGLPNNGNSYPLNPGSDVMYSCEFCEWNAPRIKSGTAW